MEANDGTNNANEHSLVKTFNWQEADQLAFYKRGRGVELGSTKKQLQLSVRAGLESATHGFKSGALTTRPCCLHFNDDDDDIDDYHHYYHHHHHY